MNQDLITPYLHPLTPLATGVAPTGTLRLPVACLLCDIYGTLLISGSGDMGVARARHPQHEKITALLAKYNQPVEASRLLDRLSHAIEQHHEEARKGGIDYPEVCIEQIWSQVLSFANLESTKQFAMEFEMLMNPVWPMPHVHELMRTCRQHGVRMGIISNAQFFTPLLLAWLLKGDLVELGFDPGLIFYSYEHNRAKPSSRLFERARRRLAERHIPADRTAFIGNDMRNDIVPAERQGFQTVLFAGDKRSLRLRRDDSRCRTTEPDLVVTDLKQLIPYLQQSG